MKKAWKIGIAGVVLMAFRVISGKIFSGGVFSSLYLLEPVNIWKKTATASDLKYYVAALVLSIVFAWVYTLLQKGIPGKNKLVKGFVFGLSVWVCGSLPIMLILHKTMTVATLVLVYWTVKGLIMVPLSGVVVAAVCGEDEKV